MKKLRKLFVIFLCIVILLVQDLNFNSAAASTNSLPDTTSASIQAADLSDTSNISVTVTLSTGGGTLSSYTKTVISGKEYGTLPTPILNGYTFDGWYTEAAEGSKVIETSIVVQNAAHTLYAHWQPIKVKIYFNGNGSILTQGNKEVYYGQAYGNLPTPSLTDYTFKGWYTLPSGGELINSQSIVNITSSVMLYAQWTGIAVNVTFDPMAARYQNPVKQLIMGMSMVHCLFHKEKERDILLQGGILPLMKMIIFMKIQ